MEQVKRNSQKILPLHPLSPRPSPLFYQQLESRHRTTNRNEKTGPRETNTLQEGNNQKDFVIKSSKERKTPVRRRITASNQQLQNLFKIVDQDEERDFLDLIGSLK